MSLLGTQKTQSHKDVRGIENPVHADPLFYYLMFFQDSSIQHLLLPDPSVAGAADTPQSYL